MIIIYTAVLCFAVLLHYRLVTDEQTDGRRDGQRAVAYSALV